MNTKIQHLAAEFGPDTRFEVKPLPPVPFRAEEENPLEQLKRRLLEACLEVVSEPELTSQVRRAANEAASLARTTAYPLLVFPVLFEERAAAAAVRFAGQTRLLRRRWELVAI